VGLILGGLFGLTSYLRSPIPLFKNPLAAILPRLLIGVTAYFAYAAMKKANRTVSLGLATVVGLLTAGFSTRCWLPTVKPWPCRRRS